MIIISFRAWDSGGTSLFQLVSFVQRALLFPKEQKLRTITKYTIQGRVPQ